MGHGQYGLPVFQEVMRKVYSGGLVGPAPQFPPQIEDSITNYLRTSAVLAVLPKPMLLFSIGR